LNKQLLSGKNCLITGATGGLGRQITIELAKNNCNLFLTSKTQSKLQKFQEELSSINNQIKIDYQEADLSSNTDLENVIKKIRKDFGEIDILINCAGIFPVNLLADSSIEDFEECFDLNVKAPFVLCKEFSNDMIKKKWGRIVNIASSGAYNGRPNTSIYRASKHALLGFSRSIYEELKEHNVRTFCISPGPIKTDMGNRIIMKENKNENFETFMDPAEIADMIIYLMSFDKEMISNEVRLSRF
jgi:short-subunit dehydrogenase